VIKDGQQYYRQNKGAMIGSQATPAFAELYMEFTNLIIASQFEKNLIEETLLLGLFVDDVCQQRDRK
jgi:hypothetical protein